MWALPFGGRILGIPAVWNSTIQRSVSRHRMNFGDRTVQYVLVLYVRLARYFFDQREESNWDTPPPLTHSLPLMTQLTSNKIKQIAFLSLCPLSYFIIIIIILQSRRANCLM